VEIAVLGSGLNVPSGMTISGGMLVNEEKMKELVEACEK
jgi:hypothetical protein